MNVLITGTSSGIGKGLAKAYLKKEFNVFGISRRVPQSFIKNKEYRHLSIDLTDYKKLKSQVPLFLKDVKSFDIVILNSGVLGDIKFITEQSVEDMKQVMEVNLWSNKVLLDTLFNLKLEIKQVVGMSTKASLRSTPGWGAYSLSKSALNMLMNIYSNEHKNTHFSAFAPGLVDSQIQEYIWNVKETNLYPSIKSLQDKRYTSEMPTPDDAADKLIKGIEKSLSYPGGIFVDVRQM